MAEPSTSSSRSSSKRRGHRSKHGHHGHHGAGRRRNPKSASRLLSDLANDLRAVDEAVLGFAARCGGSSAEAVDAFMAPGLETLAEVTVQVW